MKGEDQGLEEVTALLAQGGEIGAVDAERVGALGGAEAAGDFLLEFGHADIAFGLVVVERHLRVLVAEQIRVNAAAGKRWSAWQ